MSTPKVLILTGDAGESLEVMYPYQRLKEEGYDVQIAALSKKKLHFVVHDFEPGYDTYTEKPGYSWDADLAFKDVNPTDYAAVVIPGGRAPEYIRNDRDVQRIIRHFFDQEKPVAQLCHAPSALAALAAYAPRYAAVAKHARVPFAPQADSTLRVVERIAGSASTDFGVPGEIAKRDTIPLAAAEGKRLASLVEAAWLVYDQVVAAAPAELRKGPRGGGRDRDKIADHVLDAEGAYVRKL